MARLRAALVAAFLVLGPAFASPRVVVGAVQPARDCTLYACYTLTVSLEGDGSGTLQSTDSNYVPDGFINCQILNGVQNADSLCSHLYGGEPIVGRTTIYLKATPSTGSCAAYFCDPVEVGHWTFDIDQTQNTSFSTAFYLLTYQLSVSTGGGSGSGTVVSTPSAINCGATCKSGFKYGSSVLLTAIADPGSKFDAWTGACLGQPADCLIGVIADTATAAVFSSTSATTGPSPTKTAPPTTRPPTPSSTGVVVDTPEPAPSPTDAPAGTPVVETILPTASSPPVEPARASGSDITPIFLAIVGGGLLIAIGLGVVVFNLRRRPPGATS